MRRAKIVCTLGPASQSQEMLEALLENGMDVARLNFSHGSHEQHAENIAKLRAASLKVRKAVGILGDLQGPKIRTGRFTKGSTDLKEGGIFHITTDETVPGTDEIVSTTYPFLAADVNPGDRILLDDGLLELKVLHTDKQKLIKTEVIHGGALKNNKGINLPGVAVRADALTPKDREDLVFGIKAGVDFIALSFVRQPSDLDAARQAMAEVGRTVPIIAKLEKPEAIARLDAILDKTDGVMVARGDLGVEIPPEEVPAVQKDIIRRSNLRGLPVIVATQMLNSMIDNPRPTRAEASDVANAVFDGADAVMLSGETASGKFPIESVQMMERIILAAESSQRVQPVLRNIDAPLGLPTHFPDVIARVACEAAKASGASLIAAFTLSGVTARLLSHYRPSVPIVAFSPNQEVRRRLALLWGVVPRVLEPIQDTEAMVRRVGEELVARGLGRKGDRIVIVYGAPVGQPGKINSLRLHTIEG
ncbi:pyruvate kinase [Myxococcus sp. CA051A]|uniref:Pyruvate kinase n=1 Tax=Myxococcus llanfairpwllgwyngyllgogerychwyrndrobwllllantysiliogogogochensis TaxID=2590453 RepID=A0A540WT11_9BACT|nr:MULTISPECIES: pyruvate kinase [Myxococcus]NTX03493.1 pyruvate kinase [Myxococcus sp. CA040A]NTX11899.1 pyruvate kinase [Myxococcus sp. CA056]NTX33999.1 pyruvate kinase [Myxococcus sp. CA033]NTX54095.1 pyruvate kinase [Myxococcus sp. CA039A]NTX65814.1 pyruvate kinase [Myxococcus sp. CA051A]